MGSKFLKHIVYYIVNEILHTNAGRHWQFAQPNGGQWSLSKSFDTFLPLGDVTPASEVGDPQDLDLVTTLNGVVMQQASTKEMIFSVAEIIVFLSQSATLLPGTIILTGVLH